MEFFAKYKERWGFDLESILCSEMKLNQLLKDIPSSILVRDRSPLHLGNVHINDMPLHDIPVGRNMYQFIKEDPEERELMVSVELAKGSGAQDVWILHTFVIYEMSRFGLRHYYSAINYDEDEDEDEDEEMYTLSDPDIDQPLALCEDGVALNFKFVFPGRFRGTVKAWVVVTLKERSAAAVSITETIRITALPIRGNIVDDTTAASMNQLNSGAKNFMPQSARQNFNNPNVMILASSLYAPHVDGQGMIVRSQWLHVPTRVRPVMERTMGSSIPEFQLYQQYCFFLKHYLRMGTDDMALRFITTTMLGNHQDIDSAMASTPVAKYRRLHMLMDCEEIQMNEDLMDMDNLAVRLKINVPQSILRSKAMHEIHLSFNLICTIIVPGSSESRPPIALGNCVRLRPSAFEPFGEWSQDVATIPLYPFELQGIITNFVLKTETVHLEIGIPALPNTMWSSIREICRAAGWQSNNSSSHWRSALELICFYFDLINFQARFCFERSGFVFAKEALANVIHFPLFQKMYFPTEMPTLNATHTWANVLAVCQTHLRYALRKDLVLYDQVTKDLNEEQLRTVEFITSFRELSKRDILAGSALFAPPPYCLFGPPGTGKTLTICKAIEALAYVASVNKEPIKILATAPSDAAADEIAERLIKAFAETEEMELDHNNHFYIKRVNWWQRSKMTVRIGVMNYCELAGSSTDFDYDLPDYNEMMHNGKRVTIIITTCGTSGALMDPARFSSKKMPLNLNETKKFDYVFVDEASQALESETLVPLRLLKSSFKALAVLSGDPRQLGPATRCPLFRYEGELSLLDRLLQLPAYSNFDHSYRTDALAAVGDKKDKYQTLLPVPLPEDIKELVMGTFFKKNYRSHPELLQLPSRLFYNGALEACASKLLTHAVVGKWLFGREDNKEGSMDRLVTTPAVFVGVDTPHQHDDGNPSYYNIGEATALVRVVHSLISQKLVHTGEIKIICAFRAQVLLVRQELRKANYGQINVGNVDDLQGQESKVILVSCVLSSLPSMLANSAGGYGLYGAKRKFNVAITRGMALCVVVGSPDLLLQDEGGFKDYVELCDEKGGYFGQESSLLPRIALEKRQQEQKMRDKYPHLQQPGGIDVLDCLGSGLGPTALYKSCPGSDGFGCFEDELQRLNTDFAWKTLL